MFGQDKYYSLKKYLSLFKIDKSRTSKRNWSFLWEKFGHYQTWGPIVISRQLAVFRHGFHQCLQNSMITNKNSRSTSSVQSTHCLIMRYLQGQMVWRWVRLNFVATPTFVNWSMFPWRRDLTTLRSSSMTTAMPWKIVAMPGKVE